MSPSLAGKAQSQSTRRARLQARELTLHLGAHYVQRHAHQRRRHTAGDQPSKALDAARRGWRRRRPLLLACLGLRCHDRSAETRVRRGAGLRPKPWFPWDASHMPQAGLIDDA